MSNSIWEIYFPNKKYKSQILKHNIPHINVITTLNIIHIAKVSVKSPKKQVVISMANIKVTEVCDATNVLLKYNLHLNFIDDNKIALELEMASIKKY